jgi:hypothetical protein
MLTGWTQRAQVSAKNIQSRSAANSPLLRRAVTNSGKRASMGDSVVSDSDNDLDDDDDDDFTTDTDMSGTDISDDSDDSDDDIPVVSRSRSGIVGHGRTTSFVSPPAVTAAAGGSASPFSKGHRRGQSVDHGAFKKVAQESGTMGIPSGSVDELKVSSARGRAETSGGKGGSDEKAGGVKVKGEKKASKQGARMEAREAKAQKRKQELAQKKTSKLAKRFALTETSKYLGGTRYFTTHTRTHTHTHTRIRTTARTRTWCDGDLTG